MILPARSLPAVLSLVFLAGFAALASAQAPPNDTCAGAIPITAIPSTLTTPMGAATAETGDPVPPCYPGATVATVYWSLAVSTDQQVRIDTTNSTTNTVITVLRGGCSALVPVDCDYQYGINGTWNHGMVDFYALAGVTYHVMVSDVFDPAPDAEAVLDVSQGQCGPIQVALTDSVSTAPVAAGHAQLRDLTGGWYLIREGWTDDAGVVDLYPIFPSGDLDLQISAPGHVVTQRTVTLGTSPQRLDIPLVPLGTLPSPPAEPTRLVVAVPEGLLTLLPDGTDRHLILAPGADDPTWSPDGSQIAYVAPGQIAGNQWPQLWLVNADGTNAHQLTDDASGGYPENLDWSPAGDILAYERSGSTYTVNLASPAASPVPVWGGPVPSFSPDGSMFATPDGQGMRLVRFDGVDVPATIAALGAGIGYSPSWSPDGLQLAFSDGSYGDLRIGVVGVNGIGARAVTGDPGESLEEPAWSPDGAGLAFLNRAPEGRFLERVGLDGSGRQRVYEGSVGLNTTIDWAPATPGDVPGDMAPRVRLLTPAGGEKLAPGDVFTIRWTASDDHGIASSDLLWSDGTSEAPIATGLQGTVRSFDWTVPSSPVLAAARVIVVVRDTVGQDCRDSNLYPFTIAGPSDPWFTVRLLQPAGGEFIQGPRLFRVAWEADGTAILDPFSIELSTDGGFSWTVIEPAVPSTGRTYDWLVPDTPVSERAFLRIRAGSWPAQTWSRSGQFALNSGAPARTGLQMVKGDAEEVTITWTAVDGATSYDVIRGNLFAVRRLADRIDLGVVACVADDTVALSVTDGTRPAPGEAFFWLVRGNVGGVPEPYGRATDGRFLIPSSGDCP